MAINNAGAGGISPIAGPGGPRLTRNVLLLLGLLVGIALLGLAAIVYMNGSSKPVEHEQPETPGINLAFQRPPPEARPAPRPMTVFHPLPLPISAPPRLSMTQSAPADTSSALDAPLEAYRSNGWAGGGNGSPAAARLAANGGNASDSGNDDLSKALHGSNLGGPAHAYLLQHPEMTIPAGTIFGCTLQTAINSELAGFAICVMPEAVRSADGSVVLLDKGTTLFGEVRSGIRQGQDRIFLLWVRARTPQNVVVELNSPSSDEVGRAGVPGEVNEHFWARFGAALLFSVIDYVPQVAASALQSNNGTGNVNNYTQLLSPQQSLGNTILNQTLNIAPTIEINQGTIISIITARDLDFSSVFDLKAVDP
jgi:type IV secretion system protein VirB10